MYKFANRFLMAFCLSLMSVVLNAAPEDATGVIRVDKDRLSGMNLGEFTPYEPETGNLIARDFQYYNSKDELFGIGVWECKAGSMLDPGLAYDELMYILSGSMVMTDAAGHAETYRVGEGVIAPKDWKGTITIPEGDVRMIWASYTHKNKNNTLKTIRLDQERLSGINLGEYAPYEPEMGTLVSHGYDYFYSKDGNFGTGVWESKPGIITYKDLEYDELMYVLDGSMIMTSDDGKVGTYGKGEGLILPKGWSGTLAVPEGGVRKIWVSYMAGTKGNSKQDQKLQLTFEPLLKREILYIPAFE